MILNLQAGLSRKPGKQKDGRSFSLLMHRPYQEMLQLTPEQIERVYKSAHHIREWYDQHPEIETWEDYIRYMGKSDEGQGV